MYVQESGRAGRNGKLSCALILHTSHDLNKRSTSKQMIEYCTNKLGVKFCIGIFQTVTFYHKVVCDVMCVKSCVIVVNVT